MTTSPVGVAAESVSTAGQTVPKHEFDLPAEAPHTELPHDERNTFVNAESGETVPWPANQNSDGGNWILVCIDFDAPEAQTQTAIRAAIRTAKSGDSVILFNVLPTQVGIDGGLAALGGAYDVEYQLRMLRKLRDERKEKLVELSKAFPDDVKIFAQLSYGGVERRILHAAEEGHCNLIIMSKRKLGHWQKLVTTSVSNWIVNKAPCDVLIAK